MSHDKTDGAMWQYAVLRLADDGRHGAREDAVLRAHPPVARCYAPSVKGGSVKTEREVKVSVVRKPDITVRLEPCAKPFVPPDGVVVELPTLADLVFNYNLGVL